MFLSITPQDTLTSLVEQLLYREKEVHQYQINIDNYNQMLSTLPQGAIPDELASYASTPAEELPPEFPIETVQLLADYQWRDRVSYLIRTENIEQNKSKRILESLKAQIPSDQLDALVAAALAKINAPTTTA